MVQQGEDIFSYADAVLAAAKTYAAQYGYSKTETLSDETKTLYGKGSSASPDEIFAAIQPSLQAVQNSVSKKAYVDTGSYEGTSSGATLNNKTIYFATPVKMVFIWASTKHELWFANIPQKIMFQFGFNSDNSNNIVDSGTYYITLKSVVNNQAYGPYYYIAIG